ncbi:MAG: methyl-accepting chemotaxis protein [Azovibrio sp.]|uniref:methyl-accepting chemotaxis protein n=1 Tax=Azovibrio sp. TaxID=1872673 RepID=UPI003C762866
MNLKTRITAAMVLVFALFLVAAGVALYGLHLSKATFIRHLEVDMALERAIVGIYAQGLQSGQALRNVTLDPANKTGHANLAKALEEFGQYAQAAQALVPAGSPLAGVLAQVNGLAQARRQLIEQVVAVAVSGDQAGAIQLINSKETPLWRQIRAHLLEQMKVMKEDIERSKQTSIAAIERSEILVGVLVLASLVVAVVMLTRLLSTVGQQLGADPSEVKRVAEQVAAGNLTVAMDHPRAGSVMAAMATMQGQLAGLVGQIRQNADSLLEAADLLNRSSSAVAERSTHQSEAVAAVAAAMEEMTVGITLVRDHSGEARDYAQKSGELSRQGNEVVAQVVQGMGRVADSVTESAQVISTLERESEKIAAIVGVIKEITDQTNLLALNAAIEAARAGEQGRGFAVVADEVRKLAERTAQSTVEVAATVDVVRNGIQQGVERMEDGVRLVSSESAEVAQAGETISALHGYAEKVLSSVNEIGEALGEQSSASTEIAQRVELIAQISEQNAAAVQESAGAARQLQDLARNLSETVNHFRI